MYNSTSPNPPPPATYLADPHVIARISVLQRTPHSPEPLYKRMMCAILEWIFTSSEGFDVVQENMAGDLRPGFTVLNLLARPGGSVYEYDFLLGETKVPAESSHTFVDYLHTVCANNRNDTRNVYGVLQVGFEVQFYKYENHQFEALGDRMHLVDDVHHVIAWAQHMKANPMPFVDH